MWNKKGEDQEHKRPLKEQSSQELDLRLEDRKGKNPNLRLTQEPEQRGANGRERFETSHSRKRRRRGLAEGCEL